jgi:hypothetical protein
MNGLDGVYSIAISGPGGSAAGFISIKDTRLSGNDTLGAAYRGVATKSDTGSVFLRFDMIVPPGSIAIWSGAFAESFVKRSIDVRIPKRVFDGGEPHFIPKLATWIILSRSHDRLWRFAGPSGRVCQANLLLEADYAWRGADHDNLAADWDALQSPAARKAAE